MNSKDLIDDYYCLCSLVDDDIEAVALLIKICQAKPTKKLIEDIQDMKLYKYKDELNKLLEMKTGTLKDFYKIIKCLEDDKKLGGLFDNASKI